MQNAASSEHRKATRSATSCAVPSRCTGVHASNRTQSLRVEILVKQRGSNETGAYRVHSDTARCIFDGSCLGESHYTVLRGHISGGVGKSDAPEDRCHIHYGATPGFEHGRDLESHPLEHATEVDVDDFFPVVDRVLAAGCLGPADACVVDGNMKAAVGLHSMIYHCLDLFGIAHIDLEEARLSSLGPISSVTFCPRSHQSRLQPRWPPTRQGFGHRPRRCLSPHPSSKAERRKRKGFPRGRERSGVASWDSMRLMRGASGDRGTRSFYHGFLGPSPGPGGRLFVWCGPSPSWGFASKQRSSR